MPKFKTKNSSQHTQGSQSNYNCEGDKILEDTPHRQMIAGKRPLQEIEEKSSQDVKNVNFKRKKGGVSNYFGN